MKIKQLFILLLVFATISTTAGCELWETIKKALNDYYPRKLEVSMVIITPFPIALQDKNDPLYIAAVNKAYAQATDVRKSYADACVEFNKTSKTIITPLFFTDAKNIKAFYDLLVDEMDKAEENDEDFEVEDFARDMIKRFRKDTNNSTIQSIVFGVYIYKPEAAADAIELTFYDFQRDMSATDRAVIPRVAGRNRDQALQDLLTSLLKKVY